MKRPVTAVTAPTRLQVWLVAALDVLDDARGELDRREYEVLLDVMAARIAHDYIARLGVLDNLDDADAA